jgi:hypothetical protein
VPPVGQSELDELIAAKPDEPSRDPHVQWLVDSMDYILTTSKT